LVRLRALPILTVAVVLIAWQYRWKQVVLFSVGTTALVILLLIGQPAGFLNMLAITAVQMMSFLIIGYSTCAVMDKLRAQSMALEQANTQLRHYAATLEKLAISRERNRVARELHDTLAHTLSGLTVQLEATKAYWDVDPQAARAMVETALGTTRDGLHETRRALKALRASPLEDLGLRVALCSMAASATEAANLRLDCAVAENLPILAPDVEQCIYRIAQEAVTNAARYAGADTLTLTLSCADGRLTLRVQDNGRGFDVKRATAPGSFGISGMYERAALAGGSLSVVSAPGQGATVSFHL
jgi:signal transduction histidine kinase